MFLKKMTVKQLVLDAVFIALCAILGLFSLDLFTFKLSFEGLPVLIGAMMFGPIDGMIIGGLGTFISQLLGPYGLDFSTPLWILPFVVSGLCVGLFVKKNHKPYGEVEMRVAIVANEFIVTICNTISLMLYFELLIPNMNAASAIPGLVPRVITCVGKAFVYCFVVPPIIKALKRTEGVVQRA